MGGLARADGSGEYRRTSVVRDIGSWAVSDPAAAMNWLENIASGTARERGVIGFANFMAEKDPQNGLRLLDTLPESAVRSSTIQRVRERWRKNRSRRRGGVHHGAERAKLTPIFFARS